MSIRGEDAECKIECTLDQSAEEPVIYCMKTNRPLSLGNPQGWSVDISVLARPLQLLLSCRGRICEDTLFILYPVLCALPMLYQRLLIPTLKWVSHSAARLRKSKTTIQPSSTTATPSSRLRQSEHFSPLSSATLPPASSPNTPIVGCASASDARPIPRTSVSVLYATLWIIGIDLTKLDLRQNYAR